MLIQSIILFHVCDVIHIGNYVCLYGLINNAREIISYVDENQLLNFYARNVIIATIDLSHNIARIVYHFGNVR